MRIILITQNTIQHSKTKHIEIRHHLIMDNVEKGKIELMDIPTDDQLADIFTKPLDEHNMTFLNGKVGMLSIS